MMFFIQFTFRFRLIILLGSMASAQALFAQSTPSDVPDLPETTPPSTTPSAPGSETPAETETSGPDTPPDDTPGDPPDGPPVAVVTAPSLDAALVSLIIKSPLPPVRLARGITKSSYASRKSGMLAIKLRSGSTLQPNQLLREIVGAGAFLTSTNVGFADGHVVIQLIGPAAYRSRAWQDRLVAKLAAHPDVQRATPVYARGNELRIPTQGIWVRFATGTTASAIEAARASASGLGSPVQGNDGMLYLPATYEDGRDLLKATAILASNPLVQSVFPHQVKVTRSAE